MQPAIGGIAGVVIGLGSVFLIPMVAMWFGEYLPAKTHVPSIFLSIGVGVLFGWYPARRASMLDPIEALRHE